jgi:ribosomal protein L17
MMRHVANGGRPHDEFGQHIVSTSEDIAKLNSFSRYVTNKDQLNDNAGDIIEQTKLKLENLRGYMKNLSNQSHYENASKDFKTSEEQILDDETVNKLREKFTMKNLDNRVEDALPLINRIMSELEAPKEEEQVNELEPDAEPIDAPVQAPVDHGAVVQSFLNDPDSKLVLRKDDSADKMLKVTKFTNKNTMLSSILSDIASRLLTKTGEEDRVANFASRVADEMEQENSATFKPTPDYIKNKKIAVQLAKRYIDDYKKMQSEPGYTDQVRMDPADFNPKKDLKGKAKETEAFESWVDETVNEYAKEPRDDEDRKEKLKALQDLQANTKLRDKESQDAIIKRKQELMKEPAMAGEGNQFAQAVQKAKAAGMKAGDKFKVGDDEYTLKDAIEMAGLPLEEFFSEEEMEVPEEAQAEAEAINTELDRIKTLANLA